MKFIIKILIHTIFWIVFIAFSVLVGVSWKQAGNPFEIVDVTPHLVINTIWALIIFYLFYFHFIAYFEKRQFLRYLVYSIGVSIVITFCMLPLHKLILPSFKVLSVGAIPPMIGSFIIAQCGSLVRGFEIWFSNILLKAELETRNLRNELELLKAQINPHFLFNTLNNIDSLIHSSPRDASHSLITLSDLLRYMIYDTQAPLVLVQKEADYIKRYIELQKLRFTKPDAIKLNIDNICTDEYIAPMLFVPFIENAFKFANNTGTLPVVEITLRCANHYLYFSCFNCCNVEPPKSSRSGGIGLENVKRRLELLYPEKHKLIIQKEKNTFKVELTIHL